MIRKFTSSFIVLAALASTLVGAEPQTLLPMQPQLPPSHRLRQVSQTTTVQSQEAQSQEAWSQEVLPATQPMLSPVPESTHEMMLSDESYGHNYGNYQPQPAPVATWWSNSMAGRLVKQVGKDTHKANQWPNPYAQYDREATRVGFATMVEKGWKRQNTLGNVHFDPNTGELNMSGRVKVRRIVLEGLPSRRDLFVYRADTMANTDARLNSVKTCVDKFVGNTPTSPRVSITNLPTPGWPAQYVDAISRKYVETMPDPRIPKDSEANFTED